jgi:hypothetical protein
MGCCSHGDPAVPLCEPTQRDNDGLAGVHRILPQRSHLPGIQRDVPYSPLALNARLALLEPARLRRHCRPRAYRPVPLTP